MRLAIRTCKVWLASVWFLGCGLIFVILFVQSLGQTYVPLTRDIWEWFLPNSVPTLSLIVGILAVEAVGKTARNQTVDRFFFRLTLGLSGGYLLLIFVTILMLALYSQVPAEKVAFLKMSNLWLGPLQGLVTASLGVFFVSKAPADETKTLTDKATASGATLTSADITT